MNQKHELNKKFREYVRKMEGKERFKELSGSWVEALCVNFIAKEKTGFTKEDMIEFADYWDKEPSNNLNAMFDEWIKSKKKL